MKMKPLPLKTVAEVTGGKYVGDSAYENTLVTSVVQDSRKVEEGSLFLCIPGERVDGHDFAANAYKAGAVCCIAERELTDPAGPYILVDSTLQALKSLGAYYRSLFDIPFVGVTGSVGKTTAKELTASVLSQKYNVLKTPLNLNNEIGVPLTLLSLREEHEAAVIEMGISDFGEMTRLAEMVRPDICIMTNIGCCHLENLRDLDGVLKAKSEVFSFMSPDSYAVVCGDDDMLRNFDTGTKKVTFGLDVTNDFRGENVENQGADGISFDIRAHGTITHASIPAFGSHLVLGALPAAAVGDLLGLSPKEITDGLASYVPVEGRAHIIDTGYIRIIDDCYNANPHSVTAAIHSLCTLEGRKVAILGDMKELGSASRDLHHAVGQMVGQSGTDCLVCLGEEAEFIYKGLISSGCPVEAWHFPLKEALFSVLPSLVKKGDNVLVKASHSMNFGEIVEELKKLR